MDKEIFNKFCSSWKKYFGKAQLPITFFYSDEVSDRDIINSKNEDRCIICNLNQVRDGFTYVYNLKTPGCLGGKRYSGFTDVVRKNFNYFLSCGLLGKMEGERYKQSPELVEKFINSFPKFNAPKKYLVFKRIDKLKKEEIPEVIIFFAQNDVLSGLFTLANYDQADTQGVNCPMGSGCSSIITFPLMEAEKENPKCILGMFDVSARPCVPKNTLTFSLPYKRFVTLLDYMDESFLITNSWKDVKNRIIN